MSRSWVDDEPGLADARREFARAARRARSRWLLVVLATLGLTAAIVLLRARKPPMYGATVVFRVTEGRFDPESSPPTSASLQDHIWDVSLSASRLLDVARKFNLYPGRLSADPTWAVEGVRDDLDVDVVRNFFSEERSAEDPPRSARLAISYRAEDPQLAHDVVSHMASLVAAHETENRKRSARLGAERARVAASRMRQRLQDVRTEQARLNMALALASPEDGHLLQVRLRDTTTEIAPLEAQLAAAERAANTFELRTAFEGQDMGLKFEIVDPGRPPAVKMSRSTELIVLGVASLVLLLPFVVLGIGALDSRIYRDEDVIRLGLVPFGHVPPFPGDAFGSLADRLPPKRGDA